MLFLLILLFSFLAGIIFPWWVSGIIAFLAAFFYKQTSFLNTFLSGFFANFLLWTIIALCKSLPNHHILATRVSHMLKLNNWMVLLFITALLGGLVTGVCAISGWFVKKAFKE